MGYGHFLYLKKKDIVLLQSQMNVLINRSDALGDVILTLPMAYEIKKNFPQAKIIFLVSPRCQDLLLDAKHIDEIKVFDQNKSFFKKILALKKIFKEHKVNTYFHVGGSSFPSFVAALFRVSFRGGLISRWPSFLFLNRGVRQKRSFVEMHEIEYNLDLLAPLGLNFNYDYKNLQTPLLNISEIEKEKCLRTVEDLCQSKDIVFQKKWIVIHPGMTGHTLNWSARNYARFILKLERKLPDQFLYLITFTPSDKKYLYDFNEEFKKEEFDFLRKRVIFWDGQEFGLRLTMALLSKAQLLLAPSTGPAHIANALGTKMVAVYSPIKIQSSARWGPVYELKSKVKVVVPDVICGESLKCAGESCPYYECMSKIEVEEIVQKAMALLEQSDN